LDLDTFIDCVGYIVGTPRGAALSLSKGGWEGWLQCEAWLMLTEAQHTVEREAPYPGRPGLRCDLLVTGGTPLWVELKAFGTSEKTMCLPSWTASELTS
jgi:hypothetical protein